MAAEWDEPLGVCEAEGALLHDAGEAVDSIPKGKARGQAQGRGPSGRIFDEFAPGGSGIWGREGGEDLSGVRPWVFEGFAGEAGSAFRPCFCILQSGSGSGEDFLLGRERILGVRQAIG